MSRSFAFKCCGNNIELITSQKEGSDMSDWKLDDDLFFCDDDEEKGGEIDVRLLYADTTGPDRSAE